MVHFYCTFLDIKNDICGKNVLPILYAVTNFNIKLHCHQSKLMCFFFTQDALVWVFMVTTVISHVQKGVQKVDVTLPMGLVSVAQLDGQETPVTKVKIIQSVVNLEIIFDLCMLTLLFFNVSNLCYVECPPGSFGTNCSGKCKRFCRDPCNHISGICDNGCQDGWLGPHCNQCKQIYLYNQNNSIFQNYFQRICFAVKSICFAVNFYFFFLSFQPKISFFYRIYTRK